MRSIFPCLLCFWLGVLVIALVANVSALVDATQGIQRIGKDYIALCFALVAYNTVTLAVSVVIFVKHVR
jgi:hypothetical protein